MLIAGLEGVWLRVGSLKNFYESFFVLHIDRQLVAQAESNEVLNVAAIAWKLHVVTSWKSFESFNSIKRMICTSICCFKNLLFYHYLIT